MKRAGRGVALAIAWLLCSPWGYAQESTQSDQPAARSVEDLGTPLGRTFFRFARGEPLFPRFRQWTADMTPFVRDTELDLNARTYYFSREDLDDDKSVAWAYGGSIRYQSGWLADLFAVEAEAFTSLRAVGDEDRGGTGLLKPVQESYSVIGQLNAKLRYGDFEFVGYRQRLNMPYINLRDSRMTPNTFEAYTLVGSLEDLDFGAAYISKIKLRNRDNFISMSEAAGAGGSKGTVSVGALYHPDETLNIGAINHYTPDVYNILYAEGFKIVRPTEDLGLRFEGQFTDQRSVGSDDVTGDDFATWVAGGRVAASYRHIVVTAAFSRTDDGESIRNPWGFYPGYLSLMQRNFARAGEEAWLLGVSYDFSRWGLDGLSGFVNYARGHDAEDASTGMSLGEQSELDVTIDYRIKEGVFRGLWFRLRGAFLHVSGEGSSDEYRVIVNYELPVF